MNSVLKRPILLAASPLILAILPMPRPADWRPVVSLVTDAAVGKAESHGLEKLTAALRARTFPSRRPHPWTAPAASSCSSWDWRRARDRPRGCLKAEKSSAPARAGGLGHSPDAVARQARLDRRRGRRSRPDVCRVGRGRPHRLEHRSRRAVERSPRNGRESRPCRYRAVSIYTMNRAYWESRFYDETYWARYLDTAGAEPFQLAGRDLRLRERRLPGAALSVLLQCRGVPRRADGRHHAAATATQPRRPEPPDPDVARPRAELHASASGTTSIAAACRGAASRGATRWPAEPTPGLVWGVTEREPRPLHEGGPGRSSCARSRARRHPVPHARRIGPEERANRKVSGGTSSR